ncbi:MAG: putative toxin-antitoxin system toxin component, PIN family [Kiritimatiellaceae bacterium]|nr:putative toxin-antitoxin system toxin component, PIN family [Kiritimatiellaceae bacterium]
MRVIIDSNVAITAAAARGLCEAVLELCLDRHDLILGEGIVREIENKLRAKLKAAPPVIAEFLTVLRHNAEMFEPEKVDRKVCRDPADLIVLGLIAPGNADVVITGDKDLLVVAQYKQARIMTPRDFWEANRNQQ